MGDRNVSGWDVLEAIDNGSTKYLGNETWRIRHDSYPEGQVDDYSIQLGNDYVQVVGLTVNNEAVLIIQDRVANGPSLEVVAGGIKKGQTAEQAAHREFGEESGWRARELIYLGSDVPQTDRIVSRTEGNNGAKRCYMFLALGLSPTSQKLESTEKIQPILVPWEIAVAASWTDETVDPLPLPLEDKGSKEVVHFADRWLKEHRR